MFAGRKHNLICIAANNLRCLIMTSTRGRTVSEIQHIFRFVCMRCSLKSPCGFSKCLFSYFIASWWLVYFWSDLQQTKPDLYTDCRCLLDKHELWCCGNLEWDMKFIYLFLYCNCDTYITPKSREFSFFGYWKKESFSRAFSISQNRKCHRTILEFWSTSQLD